MLSKITPCLWFDTQAEDAAKFYTSIFKKSRITSTSYYPEGGHEMHRERVGSVLMVSFELEGQSFTALNAGPQFQFSCAVSFQVDCANQEEVDYYWDKLSEGGDPEAQQCCWLADKFGLSWQIVPTILPEMMTSGDPVKGQRGFAAMLQMKKPDIAAIQRAYEG